MVCQQKKQLLKLGVINMSKLDDVIKNVNKQYGFNIVGKIEVKERNYDRIPFKTPTLTYLFRGGLPRTVIELAGMPSAGKSTLCYSICGEAQKLFKKEYQEEIERLESLTKPKKEDISRLSELKERGYKKVVYLDSEFSSDATWMSLNGVDVDDLVFIAPENQTAEQLFQVILDLIDTDSIGLVVLDSIPALVSQQLMAKTMEEKTMGGISGPLSVFSSKLLPMCHKHDCAFIGINQTRDDISGYHQIITPGGRMWRHSCSLRLLIKKGKYYDENYKELTSHCEQAVGNYAEVEVLKNKATKPDRRMTKFSITYDCGIDGVNDCFEMAVALHIIDKSGAWYSDLDDNDIPKTDSDGNMLKWQGKARAMEYIKSHIDYYNDLLNTVNQEVSKE